MNRVLYWFLVLACVALAGYCFLWAIQTAWLGSFPGRDVELYRLRTYSQLAASVFFLVAALVVGIRYRRRAPPTSEQSDA